MEIELLRLLPASFLPAAALAVLIFRESWRRDQATARLTDKFLQKIEAIEEAHRKQIDAIIQRVEASQHESQSQQRTIIDDYIAITKETVVAIKGLESGVRELKEMVVVARNQRV